MSNQILTVTAGGPTEGAADARLSSLVDTFLKFRATQLRSVTAGLVEGYRKRLDALRDQVEDLTQEYSRISTTSPLDQGRLNEVVTARSTLTTQITDVQQAIEDATIQTEAAVTSTHVIDDPVAVPLGTRRQLVLFPLSGAVLGGVIALGRSSSCR